MVVGTSAGIGTALIRGRMLDTEMEGSNLDCKEKEIGNHWGFVN